MEPQNIVVGLIILSALAYAGSLVWKKSRAFSKKGECGTGCGCGTKSTKFVQ
ncbi:MAG TPA: FeoB-associated Cys-rich membrane protein [Pyrinomonadaceae bacterium]|nr:FeoB-associated Cys-rich membrane protein [Pyrinomonadaceae bacterium]